MLASGVILGIAAGLLARGDLRRLSDLRPRWWPLLFVAIAGRALAAAPLGETAQRGVYVVALWLLVLFVSANLALPGAVVIGAGIFLNALVITLNGGAMPISSEALGAAGATPPGDALHRRLTDGTALPILSDVIPLSLFRGVYSVGDIALSAGAGALIARVMTKRP